MQPLTSGKELSQSYASLVLRFLEAHVVERHVGFDFLPVDLPLFLLCLRTGFDGEWNEIAIYRLVVAEYGFELLFGAANGALVVDLYRDVRVGVEIVGARVTVLQSDVELVDISALDLIHPPECDLVALPCVVHDRLIEVCIDEDVAHLVLTQRLGIFLSLEWIDLPSSFAVPRIH